MSADNSLLTIEYVPLEDAVLWDRNPKRHDIGALVAVVDRGSRAVSIITCVKRCATRAERHCQSRAAVVLQGTKQRISVDAGAGVIRIAEVSATIGDGAEAIMSFCAICHDGVLKSYDCGVLVDTAAIAGHGAVTHGQRAEVGDAATLITGAVTGEGAVAHGQCTTIVNATTRATRGKVAQKSAVVNGQCTSIVDAASRPSVSSSVI